MVTDEDCAACDFNRPGKTCLRKMEWVWRGETYAASTSEYYSIKNQLQARCAAWIDSGTEGRTMSPSCGKAPEVAPYTRGPVLMQALLAPGIRCLE